MHEHGSCSTSLHHFLRSFISNYDLVAALTKREVLGRYQGSVMGLLWSLFNPILLLTVYTFVFSVIFKARWAGGQGTKTEFALVLFAGLMAFNLFAECINRAPGLVLGNANYVKKVVFPLEILPLVSLGSALFHLSISMFVWLVFYLIFFGLPPVTIWQAPFVLVPLILLTLGLSLLLACLGVYLRDVAQVVGITTTVMLFLSPIFYPISALPEAYQPLMLINPVSLAVEQLRDVLIWGESVDPLSWAKQMLVSVTVLWFGFAMFQKMRKGFADVI